MTFEEQVTEALGYWGARYSGPDAPLLVRVDFIAPYVAAAIRAAAEGSLYESKPDAGEHAGLLALTSAHVTREHEKCPTCGAPAWSEDANVDGDAHEWHYESPMPIAESPECEWSSRQITAVREVWPTGMPVPKDTELRRIVIAVNGTRGSDESR